MHGKQGRGQPGAGNLEPAQNPPEKNRIGGMQQHIDDEVAGRVQSPEVIFDPEGRKNQRVILWRGAGLEPDLVKAWAASQGFVGSDVGVVIPKKGPAGGRRVNDHRQQQQACRLDDTFPEHECWGCQEESWCLAVTASRENGCPFCKAALNYGANQEHCKRSSDREGFPKRKGLRGLAPRGAHRESLAIIKGRESAGPCSQGA